MGKLSSGRLFTNALLLIGLALAYKPAAAAGEAIWNLNDVSYLFQLPQSSEDNLDRLLDPTRHGTEGELLPKEAYVNLPTILNAGHGNPTLFNGAVRVVSVRIDPCPSLDKTSCAPEVRMVWQPIEIDIDENKWFARDGAAHSFYSLSKAKFAALKNELWQIKLKYANLAIDTNNTPLGIHPALLNSKTAKDFNSELQSVLLKYCGENNLKKLTFMSLLVPTRWWRFGSFIRDHNNQWHLEAIPRLGGATIEDLFNVALESNGSSKGPGRAMDAIFNIIPEEYPAEDEISPLINKSYRSNDEHDLPVFKDKLHAIERFRNPHRTNPNTLDCASCHYADASLFYAGTRFPELKKFKSKDSYKNPNPGYFNLQNITIAKEATRIVRAFGFFNDQPALNQRTIHDSAESAHWMNQRGVR